MAAEGVLRGVNRVVVEEEAVVVLTTKEYIYRRVIPLTMRNVTDEILELSRESWTTRTVLIQPVS